MAEAQEAFEKLKAFLATSITREGRTAPPLHRYDHSSGERGTHHRAGRERALPQDLEASILHQRGHLGY